MNNEQLYTTRGLLDFIDSCPTSYHTVSRMKEILDARGFMALDEKDSWKPEPGRGYYIERNGSSLAVFIIGTEPPESGFLLAGAHTDSPGLKLKTFPGDPLASRGSAGLSTIPVKVYGGPIISTWLDRDLSITGGGSAEDCYRAKAASFLISVDGAHAVHPNFSEKHDPDFSPVLNGGPAIKINAGFKYATTSEGISLFEEICVKTGTPVQKFAMRSDLPCGSTIGAMTSALAGIKTVDVGIPMLAMHSIRETAGVLDQGMMITVLSEFFRN